MLLNQKCYSFIEIKQCSTGMKSPSVRKWIYFLKVFNSGSEGKKYVLVNFMCLFDWPRAIRHLVRCHFGVSERKLLEEINI